MLPCHHEDSNPVLLVTKEVFYLSNSGGERYGENHQLKKERNCSAIELPAHLPGPTGTRTRNLSVRIRSNPLLHIAVPVRTVGIEPTTPVWKTGMFPLHHVHESGTRRIRTCCLPGFNRALIRMSLSSTSSRREESNLRRLVPNQACFRYTTSDYATARWSSARRSRLVAWHHCAVVKERMEQ